MSMILNEEQIFNGLYEPKDALIAIRMLLKCKMDFKKTKHLTAWELDHRIGFDVLNKEVGAIEQSMEKFIDTVNEARTKGRKVELKTAFSLKISE